MTFPWNSWLLIALGMLLAVVVALWASSSHVQTPASQPRQDDDFPLTVARLKSREGTEADL